MPKPLVAEPKRPGSAKTDRIRSTLRAIDWSFSSPFTPGRSGVRLFDCRKYHWYPGTFIPEIPHALIEVLSDEGAHVFDPFSGIGTTVFQAALLGRQPYGTEMSRVAVGVSRAMWRLFSPRYNLASIAERVEAIVTEYNPARNYTALAKQTKVRIDELRPWFAQDTFNALMYLATAEGATEDAGVRAAVRIAASSTLKAVCAQQRGWGCVADNVRPKREELAKARDTLGTFRRKIRTLLGDIGNARHEIGDTAKAVFGDLSATEVIERKDARMGGAKPTSQELLITSPPYLNMTDYAYAQRLSYYWLGGEPEDDVPVEIGARRKRFHRALAAQNYVEDMRCALVAMARALRPGGYGCFVIPQFETEGDGDIDRGQALQYAMAALLDEGLNLTEELERLLPVRRRHHNQQWTRLERETVAIYRKQL